MKRLNHCFVFGAALVFALTAAMKTAGLLYGVVGVGPHDLVFPSLSMRTTMWVAVLLELACASVCLRGRDERTKLYCILWLAAVFMSYRLCLWADGRRLDCPCLGYLRVGSAGFRSGVSVALGWFLVTTAVGSVLLIMADEWRTRHGRQPVARRRHEAKSPVHEQCGGSTRARGERPVDVGRGAARGLRGDVQGLSDQKQITTEL
jgi:hypothetical protein